MADEEEGMKVPYLSATRLKIAKDCSLYYEHQYDPKTETAKVLKKKANHPSNTQAARLGNIVHGALEDWAIAGREREDPEAEVRCIDATLRAMGF